MSIQGHNPLRPSVVAAPAAVRPAVEPSAPVQPAPAAAEPKAFQPTKATLKLGAAPDLEQLRTMVRASDQVKLKARVSQLQGSHFYNGLTRFFHKIFNSETYQTYRSEKAVLRGISDLRSEAAALLMHAQVSGDLSTRRRAEALQIRADLLDHPPLSAAQQQVALKRLGATPEGCEQLYDLAGLGGLSEQQLNTLASTQTSESLQDMSPIRRFVLESRLDATQLVLNDLRKMVTQPESEELRVAFNRFNPTASLADKVASHMMEVCHRQNPPAIEFDFIFKVRELLLRNPLPALAEFEILNQELDNGQINLDGETIRRFQSALAEQDTGTAMVTLKKLMESASSRLTNSLLELKGLRDFHKKFSSYAEYQNIDLGGLNYQETMARVAPHKPELHHLLETDRAFNAIRSVIQAKKGPNDQPTFSTTLFDRFRPEASPAKQLESHMLEFFTVFAGNQPELNFFHALQKITAAGAPPSLADLETIHQTYFSGAFGRLNVSGPALEKFKEALSQGDQVAALDRLTSIALTVIDMHDTIFKDFEQWRNDQRVLPEMFLPDYRHMHLNGCSYSETIKILAQHKPELGLNQLLVLDTLQKSGLVEGK